MLALLLAREGRAAAATPAPAPATKKPAASAAKPATAATRSPLQVGADARGLEEVGAYGQAREALRALRRRVAPDADLDLALAIDEARTGQ
ncbi:MAG TPA: hypothetical protein VI792_01240, partial [Candidatus Eisenbacteria bacterium]